MPEIEVNAMIWENFVTAALRAAVHLGQEDQEKTVVPYFTETAPESK